MIVFPIICLRSDLVLSPGLFFFFFFFFIRRALIDLGSGLDVGAGRWGE